MSPKKRAQEEGDGNKRKKQKISNENASTSTQPVTSVLSREEVDFPRGGGSSFTPIEYKQIRAEAIKELKDDVFKVCEGVHTSLFSSNFPNAGRRLCEETVKIEGQAKSRRSRRPFLASSCASNIYGGKEEARTNPKQFECRTKSSSKR